MNALAVVLLLVAFAIAAQVQASPVERIVARVRVLDDARFGHLRLCGTVDSVRYFGGRATTSARRDSALLCIQTDAFPVCPPGESCAEPWAFRQIDASGDGWFEWMARVEGFGFYRADYPADGMQRGQGQPSFFRDPGAFVRVTYADSVIASVTAWGTEVLLVPQADSTLRDVGQEMVQVNDSTYQFTNGLREGRGGRYVIRTTDAWTIGASRWLGLELVRDTTVLQALVP